MDFENKGFDLIGIFDKNSEVIGRRVRGLPIRDVSDLTAFCQQYRRRWRYCAIPKEAAQEIADLLVGLGIRGFWNFSHYDLAVNYDSIVVENVPPGGSACDLELPSQRPGRKEAAKEVEQK